MIIKTLMLLCVAAVLGVISATGVICGIEKILHPTMSCDMRIFWVVGIPIAVAFALFIGFPATLIFRKFKLFHWWQFVLGATLIAVPFYVVVGEPFKRHSESGLALLYLGSGALSGLFYWFFAIANDDNVNIP